MTTIIADDDKTLLLLHSTFIKRNGICDAPITCLNGKETVETLQKLDTTKPILLFLDLNMPVMDGWDVLDFIHQNRVQFSHVHVIVVTSSVRNEDEQRAKQYEQVKRFVIKPINSAVLDSIKLSISA